MSGLFMVDDLKIAISGGGLGGLACALALQQKGFSNVIVFEKDSHFNDRKQGYGLTLTNNEKGPLAKLNILNEVLSKDCPSYQHWVFKSSGEVCGYYGRIFKHDAIGAAPPPSSSSPSNHSSRGNIRIPRQSLRKILLDKLKPGTVQWNRKIKDYHENIDSVDIILEQHIVCDASDNGHSSYISTHKVDILIGADGIHSVVRMHRDKKNNRTNHTNNKCDIIIQSPLKYVGVSVIIGLSTASHDFITEGGFYVLDGVHRLFVMPFREASKNNPKDIDDDENKLHPHETDTPEGQLTMWQLSFSGLTESEGMALKNLSQLELQLEAKRRTKDWFSPVQELIHQTSLSEIWATPLYDRDPMIMTPKHKKNDGNKNNDSEEEGGYNNNNNNNNSDKQRKRKLQGLLGDDLNNSNTNNESGTPQSQSANENSCLQCSPDNTAVNTDDKVNDNICNNTVVTANEINNIPIPTPPINPIMSRVTVLGDACHPMSMFKGQGCNQALEDGPLLSSWLSKPGLNRKNIATRLRCFEREMIGRTSSKVLASRQAAQLYHSLHAVTEVDYGFEGIHNHHNDNKLNGNKKEQILYKNITANNSNDKKKKINTTNTTNKNRLPSVNHSDNVNNTENNHHPTDLNEEDEKIENDVQKSHNIEHGDNDDDDNGSGELTLFLEQLKLQQINASLGSELKPTLLHIINTIRSHHHHQSSNSSDSNINNNTNNSSS